MCLLQGTDTQIEDVGSLLKGQEEGGDSHPVSEEEGLHLHLSEAGEAEEAAVSVDAYVELLRLLLRLYRHEV